MLPWNGPDYALNPDLQHLMFTGQTWPAHATKGIDWDLYLVPDGAQRFLIGSWGHNQQSSAEASQFQKANGIRLKSRSTSCASRAPAHSPR